MFKLPMTLISISTLILAGCSGAKTPVKAAAPRTQTPGNKEPIKTNEKINQELKEFRQRLVKVKGELELYIKKVSSSALKKKLNKSLIGIIVIEKALDVLEKRLEKGSKTEDLVVTIALGELNNKLDTIELAIAAIKSGKAIVDKTKEKASGIIDKIKKKIKK